MAQTVDVIAELTAAVLGNRARLDALRTIIEEKGVEIDQQRFEELKTQNFDRLLQEDWGPELNHVFDLIRNFSNSA